MFDILYGVLLIIVEFLILLVMDLDCMFLGMLWIMGNFIDLFELKCLELFNFVKINLCLFNWIFLLLVFNGFV